MRDRREIKTVLLLYNSSNKGRAMLDQGNKRNKGMPGFSE